VILLFYDTLLAKFRPSFAGLAMLLFYDRAPLMPQQQAIRFKYAELSCNLYLYWVCCTTGPVGVGG
jgi:hypothetical protein